MHGACACMLALELGRARGRTQLRSRTRRKRSMRIEFEPLGGIAITSAGARLARLVDMRDAWLACDARLVRRGHCWPGVGTFLLLTELQVAKSALHPSSTW